jgi:hypothetical protein
LKDTLIGMSGHLPDGHLTPIARQAQRRAELVDLGADAPITGAVPMRSEAICLSVCRLWRSFRFTESSEALLRRTDRCTRTGAARITEWLPLWLFNGESGYTAVSSAVPYLFDLRRIQAAQGAQAS